MRHRLFIGLALAGRLLVSTLHAAGSAQSVVSYNPGNGFATEFGTGLGFTNSSAVLGDPSRVTPGQFGGPVDPFNPPYLRDQVASIGAGGFLTVRFSSPIPNAPGNSFGLDFIIFGNSGFVITNGDFSGGGITDGSLFGGNPGTTRVSVSADNVTYYTLDPALAPTVDRYFPTDGAGDFSRPLDPAITPPNLAGKDISGIRSLYAGSGGGAAFDISWARDANGRAVSLTDISFIRVDVLTGAAEIDAITAVPEPASLGLMVLGAALVLGNRRIFPRAGKELSFP